MSERPVPFAPGEWFHCFSRGVDKRKIFMDEHDADRCQMLLYTCNGTEPIHISNMALPTQKDAAMLHVFAKNRGISLVEIGGYCLMPNHLHLLLREIDYGGISIFMQKFGTAYTMYFNKKYERTGALFSGKFKALHVASDAYFRRVINYIHANPAELYEPRWKEGIVRSETKLEKQLLAYPYSSLPDYEGKHRPQNIIIDKSAVLGSLNSLPSFDSLLEDARTFYRQEKETLLDIEG